MNFRKLRMTLLRIRLEKSDFYEDIIFEKKLVSKDVKRIVAEWMTNLQNYKQIRVEKFKELFNELDEIIFPIKIKESHSYRSLEIEFLDDEGKEYYMSKRNLYNYHNMKTYIIGRKNSSLEPLVDRDFHYKISEDKTIILTETGAMRLKQDGTNDDIAVDFCYDSEKHTTEAKLKSYISTNKIKIKYPTMSDEFDKMVLAFLFDSNETKWYYYNVFPILKWIAATISDEKVSISITAEIEGEICSEIDVVNGIVQKYITTEIINEGEMHIIKKIFAKDLKIFLTENS